MEKVRQREIKFRCFWERQMRYNAIVGNGQVLFIPSATGEYKWINVAECDVMQSSELPDKKGQNIYEGDVVRYILELPESGETEYTEVVEFSEGCFTVDGATPLYVVNEFCEILGNIWENSDLLSQGEIKTELI